MIASMRPGLLCPGKQPLRRRPRHKPHCFNEAGAVMPRKTEAEEMIAEET